mgnify:CR=1 FL=1
MKNKRNGFTLTELLIVVAIIGVLVAVSIPVFSQQLEKSREATDLANVRSAYAELMADVMDDPAVAVQNRIVLLKQKQNDWQAYDPVTIGGITHYKSQPDTDHWVGVPGADGNCVISYNPRTVGIVFTWSGGSAADTVTRVDFNISPHETLKSTTILEKLKQSGNTWFELDSTCPNSTMLPEVKAMITSNSLLHYGTYGYFGSPSNDASRYLFWTSVDTRVVGAGETVPIIVSRADGSYYVHTSTTASRTNKGKTYVTISDHLWSQKAVSDGGYISGTKYDTLADAYSAYEKLVNESYPKYKETLLK